MPDDEASDYESLPKAPPLLVAALCEIRHALEAARQTGREGCDPPDPFLNTGGRFECDAFRVSAYDWHERDGPGRPNFECGDVRVWWYKHCRRDTRVNRPVTADEVAAVLDACLAAVGKVPPATDDERDADEGWIRAEVERAGGTFADHDITFSTRDGDKVVFPLRTDVTQEDVRETIAFCLRYDPVVLK